MSDEPIALDDPVVARLVAGMAGYLDAAKEKDPVNVTTFRQCMAMSAVMAYFVAENHEAPTMTVNSIHGVLDVIRLATLRYVEAAVPERVSQELAEQIDAIEEYLLDTDPRFASDFDPGRA